MRYILLCLFTINLCGYEAKKITKDEYQNLKAIDKYIYDLSVGQKI